MRLHLAFACGAAAAALATPVSAGTGLAGDISIETTPFVGSTSRADVVSGLLKGSPSEPARQPANPFELTGYTRAAAREDYIKSRAEARAMTGEDSGSATLSRTRPGAGGTREMGGPGR